MRKEIAILAAVAVGSMALGFLLVLLLVGPGDRQPLPDPFAPGAAAIAVQEPAAAAQAGPAPAKPAAAKAAPAAPQVPASTEGTWAIDPLIKKPDAATTVEAAAPAAPPQAGQPAASPASPPQAAPAKYSGKVALEAGAPFVWRCWAEGSDAPLEKDSCGTLAGVDGLVAGNMGAIEQCLVDSLGASATGTLSLALKIDYTGGRVKAWLGNSTKIEKMEAISGCIRTAMEGAKPPAVDHEHAVYIVFVTIGVGS